MVTLVLLPGLDGTGQLFAPLLRELPAAWSVQVVSYPPDARLDYDALTELAWAALPPGDLVLLGESFSGPIAIRLAARLGARLQALILCCTFASAPRPRLAAALGWLPCLPPGRAIPDLWSSRLLLGVDAEPETRHLLAGVLQSLPGALVLSRLKAVGTVDVREQLRDVRAPVLYVQAGHDRLVPALACTQMQKVLPAMAVVRLPGPHGLLQAAPGAAAAAIRSFLASASG